MQEYREALSDAKKQMGSRFQELEKLVEIWAQQSEIIASMVLISGTERVALLLIESSEAMYRWIGAAAKGAALPQSGWFNNRLLARLLGVSEQSLINLLNELHSEQVKGSKFKFTNVKGLWERMKKWRKKDAEQKAEVPSTLEKAGATQFLSRSEQDRTEGPTSDTAWLEQRPKER